MLGEEHSSGGESKKERKKKKDYFYDRKKWGIVSFGVFPFEIVLVHKSQRTCGAWLVNFH